ETEIPGNPQQKRPLCKGNHWKSYQAIVLILLSVGFVVTYRLGQISWRLSKRTQTFMKNTKEVKDLVFWDGDPIPKGCPHWQRCDSHDGAFVYSAHYDDRPRPPVIRVVGLARLPLLYRDVSCHFYGSDDGKISRTAKGQLTSVQRRHTYCCAFVICPLEDADGHPFAVAVDSGSSSLETFLIVHYSQKRNHSKDDWETFRKAPSSESQRAVPGNKSVGNVFNERSGSNSSHTTARNTDNIIKSKATSYDWNVTRTEHSSESPTGNPRNDSLAVSTNISLGNVFNEKSGSNSSNTTARNTDSITKSKAASYYWNVTRTEHSSESPTGNPRNDSLAVSANISLGNVFNEKSGSNSSHTTARNTDSITKTKAKNYEWNITRCFPALHSKYDNHIQIAEMVAASVVMGVDHFVFYVQNVGPSVLKGVGLAEVYPWNLNPSHKFSMHYMGQYSAIQDCVYRHLRSSRYVLLGDVDELFVPRSHHNLLPLLDAYFAKGTACGAYLFLNTFFDPRLPTELPPTDRRSRAFIQQHSLPALSHPNRYQKIYRRTERSKPAVDPSKIVVGSVHVIDQFVRGFRSCTMPKGSGLLHHYRIAYLNEVGNTVTKDRHLWRYADAIVKWTRRLLDRFNDEAIDTSGPVLSTSNKDTIQKLF
ncbi:hypothetical protein BaRGS_00016608, partial [Batillaria attramentaria]